MILFRKLCILCEQISALTAVIKKGKFCGEKWALVFMVFIVFVRRTESTDDLLKSVNKKLVPACQTIFKCKNVLIYFVS